MLKVQASKERQSHGSFALNWTPIADLVLVAKASKNKMLLRADLILTQLKTRKFVLRLIQGIIAWSHHISESIQ